VLLCLPPALSVGPLVLSGCQCCAPVRSVVAASADGCAHSSWTTTLSTIPTISCAPLKTVIVSNPMHIIVIPSSPSRDSHTSCSPTSSSSYTAPSALTPRPSRVRRRAFRSATCVEPGAMQLFSAPSCGQTFCLARPNGPLSCSNAQEAHR
jgi:hypothetical protein